MPGKPTTRGPRLAVAVLAAAVAALAFVHWSLLESEIDISPEAPGSAVPAGRPAAGGGLRTALDGKAPETFSETLSRPLFNRARRPVTRNAAAPPAEAAAPADMRLVGVVRGKGERSRALIRFANEPLGKWVAEGEEVNGWTLRDVKERSVIVELRGRAQELLLAQPRRPPEETEQPDPKAPQR